MVQELAITATLGVSLMIFTNKLLLPILLSFMQLSARDAKKIKGKENSGNWLWARISAVATPRYAAVMIAGALVLLGAGVWKAKQLHIGDLGQGVPELRETARYNRDVDVISKSFAVGVDVLGVIAEGNAPAACVDLDTPRNARPFRILHAPDRRRAVGARDGGFRAGRDGRLLRR